MLIGPILVFSDHKTTWFEPPPEPVLPYRAITFYTGEIPMVLFIVEGYCSNPTRVEIAPAEYSMHMTCKNHSGENKSIFLSRLTTIQYVSTEVDPPADSSVGYRITYRIPDPNAP
jgi:hypothetical protein